MSHWENFSEIARLFTFWSTFTYNFEKINESKIDVNHCTLIRFVSTFPKIIHHFLKTVILRGELMSLLLLMLIMFNSTCGLHRQNL